MERNTIPKSPPEDVPGTEEPKKTPASSSFQIQTINLRYTGLFLLVAATCLTFDISQPLLLIIVNLLTISLIIASISITPSSNIQYLILAAEMLRTPVILFKGHASSTILLWTIHSLQTLLLTFPDSLYPSLIFIGWNSILVLFCNPRAFISSVIYPLISSGHDSQDRSLLFIYSIFSCVLLNFYTSQNKALNKFWMETVVAKDNEILELNKKVTQLEQEKVKFTELTLSSQQAISNHLSILSAYSQIAFEEAGSKTRENILKVDAHAQLVDLALINAKTLTKGGHDFLSKRVSTARLASFLERMWRVIASTICDESFKGTMKISRGIPKKLNVNVERFQLIVLNLLLFLRQTAKTVHFKVSIVWDDIFANLQANRVSSDRGEILTSLNSCRSAAEENDHSSALLFPKDHVILDSNRRLLSSTDLVDVLEGMQGTGLLKIKISVRCDDDIARFVHKYFSDTSKTVEEKSLITKDDPIASWKQLASSTLRPILYATKNTNNLLIRQKANRCLSLEFYESAELVCSANRLQVDAGEGNYWAGSFGNGFFAREKPQEPSSGMLQRSFASLYKVGSYPKSDKKRVLIVDDDVWSQQFLEKFFIKSEYTVSKLKENERLLDMIKVEYDSLDLIVIHDSNSDPKVFKSAANVHSFLKIVNHPPIPTVIISELESKDDGTSLADSKSMKIIRKPLNLKELREIVTEKG